MFSRRLLSLLGALSAVAGTAFAVFPVSPGDGALSFQAQSGYRAAKRAHGRPPTAQRLRSLSGGTYIEAVIAEHDSVLERWPQRIADPIRVWIAPGDSLPGWTPAFARRVENAFADWESIGIPVRFAFIGDSSAAEVHLRWVDTLSAGAAGVTDWTSDANGFMQSAEIRLAMRASDGNPQDSRGVTAIALHEIGHLLGLAHSPSASDIMAPWVTADDLTDEDRATARLLYSLAPGRVR